MADPNELALDLLRKLVQPHAEDPSGNQLVIRALAKIVRPTIVDKGTVQDLDEGDLNLTTDFSGPWQCDIIALKFFKVVGGIEVPNAEPKDFGFYLVLNGQEFALVEEKNWDGTSVTLTDRIALADGDHIRVRATGTGFARVETRGEQL